MTPQPEYIKVVLTVPLKEWKYLRTEPKLTLAHALTIGTSVQLEIQKQEPEFYVCPSCKNYYQALLGTQDYHAYCAKCNCYLHNKDKVTNFHQLIAGNC
jgi:hypothetical protein